MTQYHTIVFMEGDDYREAETIADQATWSSDSDVYWPGLYRGTAEWCTALFEHLQQWDYGDPGETDTESPWGSDDDTAVFTPFGVLTALPVAGNYYVLSWHTGLQSASLTYVDVTSEEES